MESLTTTRDLVPPAGPSLGEDAAVGTLDMLSAEGGQPNEHQYANLCARTQTSNKKVQYNNNKFSSFKFPPWEKHLFILNSRPRLTCFKCCFSLKVVSTSHIPLCALNELEPPASVVSISIEPSHMVSHHHIRFHIPVNHSPSTYPSQHNAPHSRWPPLPVL